MLRPGRVLLPSLLTCALALGGCSAGPEAAQRSGAETIQGHEIRAHLRFLSHDLLEGRAPGTRGGRLAAQYIAAQFEAFGLQPVRGSYFQTFPVLGSTPLEESAVLTFRGGGRRFDPSYARDFVLWAGDPTAERLAAEGELVFVGYGIEAPEANWSDFAGEDLRGKVLLALVNDPPATEGEPDLFGGPAMTYYGRWTYKLEEAARQGALGVLLIHTTPSAGYGWSVVRGSWTGEQYALPPDPQAPRPPSFEGWLSRETAAAVLALGDLDLEALMAQAASRDFRPVPTGITAGAALRSEVREMETANVVGVLPGSSRAEEVVTVTSHYDHLGIREAVEGDSIYNGAFDNASGVALLLEMAQAFTLLPERPARTVVFIATGAEEAGLLGAEWYVANPVFPLNRTVATVNVDGANLFGETEDMVAMGADRNELGAFVEARARQMGLQLRPDPEPEKGFFFRSDHFPFARAGVPALYLDFGRTFRGRPEGWGDRMMDEYTAERYHAPGDEFSEDFVYDGAVQHGTLAFLTTLDIARDNSLPNWFEGSEFRGARDASMAGSGVGGPEVP